MKPTVKINKRISVLGLGQMGGKITELYAEAGYEVTAWNRTLGKKLKESGNIHFAATAAEAILASSLILVVVSNNNGVKEILEGLPDIGILANRVLINFTTGSPAEAEELDNIISKSKGVYIHGAIQASPDQLGLESVTILTSGNKSAFMDCADDLNVIGGNVRHLGDRAAASSAMDTATSTWIYGSFLGLI